MPFTLQRFIWKLAAALCTNPSPAEETRNQFPLPDGRTNTAQSVVEHNSQSEWKILVTALDRLLFVTYTVLITVCLILVFPWPASIISPE